MCSKYVCVVLVATFVCGAMAGVAVPAQDNSEKELIDLINRVDNEPSVSLFGGLRVDRVEGARSYDAGRSIESLDERAARYLETHELNLALSFDDENENDEESTGRAVQESRGKKMKKMLLPLLLVLKLKKTLICKVMFAIVKFISLKSLAISILALILAGAQFFKDMMGKKKDHITTAYITGAPQAEIVHSDWNRSGQAGAQELAYNHYGLAQPF